MIIREFFLTEYDQYKDRLTELLLQLTPAFVWNDDWVQHIVQSHTTVVFGCFADKDLVGIAVGNVKQHFTGRELYIDDVVVDVRYRGRRVGAQLLARLEESAKARGCNKIVLNCSRSAARHFYKRVCGFSLNEKTRMLEKPL